MIKFKMFKIQVKQFAILNEDLSENLQAKFQLTFGVNPASQCVGVRIMLNLDSNETPCLLLETECLFKVAEDNWAELTSEGKTIIPKSLLTHFAVHAVGTTRGILHCKTEGSALNGFVLPPINVTEIVEEDLSVQL